MEKNEITIHEKNIYEERAKEFFESKRASKLQKKYTPLPYEKEYEPLYYLALIGSYLFNGVSIATASTWVFSYVYSVIQELPFPFVVASFITLVGLGFLEVFQRFCGTKFFRAFIAYEKKKYGLLIGMVAVALISISLSFFGGIDVVKVATTPPLYEAPKLESIEAVDKKYQALINGADKTAKEYYERRKYAGRIATEDAEKYQEYLDKKLAYQDSLLVAVNAARQRNENKVKEAKETHKLDTEKHKQKSENKGTGLGIFAIISAFLMYFCLWYLEYYDFETVSQYAKFRANGGKQTNNAPSNINKNTDFGEHKTSTPPPFEFQNEYGEHPTSENKLIGFYTEAQRKDKLKELYIHDIQPYIQRIEVEPTQTPQYVDKHTVEHKNFRTGIIEHLDFKTVENRASIYVLKIKKSISSGNLSYLPNQYGKLKYWREKRQEFFKK